MNDSDSHQPVPPSRPLASPMPGSLPPVRDLLINNQWLAGHGEPMVSHNPANDELVWAGRGADAQQVDQAVAAARAAQPRWASLTLTQRESLLQEFALELNANRQNLAQTISREVGKPLWESLAEVKVMIAKVNLSIDAYRRRRAVERFESSEAENYTCYKPHGVVAVFGPFNLPGHLPNGHVVPALLAGNTVVFKPSERTPAVGQILSQMWRETKLPSGAFNLLQGDRHTGEHLANHPDLDGIFFTGGTAGGLAIHEATARQPQKILALEMGGNSPLVVDEVQNVQAAAYLTIVSAYITSGQRCNCARRLILPPTPSTEAFIKTLIQRIEQIRVGPWDSQPAPFMGPMIDAKAAERILQAQEELIAQGARPLVRMRSLGPTMVTPGLIDVTDVPDRGDTEYFGPLLQLIRVPDFEQAIHQANQTRYGLAAGLIADDRDKWDTFYQHARAGIINWNRPTNGASGQLPFGGVGLSGNHRPSGYWAADYCSHPVASMRWPEPKMPEKVLPGLGW